MALSRRTQDLLAKEDFDSIEEDWLARMAEGEDDLEVFVGVARGLVGHGEEERARFLLQLLEEHLREGEDWRRRLRLLRRAGEILLPEAEALHGEILETLRRLHGSHSAFDGLVETVGLTRAAHDIPKTWEKVERLEGLVAFDVGAVVRMEGKGAGRVTEVNLGLESFRIDFEGAPRLAVGFRAATKVLERIPPDHVLRRKLEAPEALAALAAADPPELLRVVLTSRARPLTAAEIRRDLAGVVADAGWTAWWAAARRHPQVVAGGGGRQTYAWAESGAEALDSVAQAFDAAPPRRQIELLRRDGGRDPALKARMQEVLRARGVEAAAADPGLAAEIWYALEREGGAPEEAPWSPAALITGAEPQRTLAGVQDRGLRERTYDLVREGRSDWPDLYFQTLSREEDPRILDRIAGALKEERPEELERFLDGVVTQAHKLPAAFTWIVERTADGASQGGRNPLRLLQQLLAAPTRPEFAPHRARLLRQCVPGGAAAALIGQLGDEQAAAAEEAAQRAGGLEPYQREELLRALHLRFPALKRDSAAPGPLHALPASIAAKRAELDEILKVEIPANRKAIEEARAMGDLRENFEYKSARQRHEYLTARASQLNEQLHRARPLDLASVDAAEVRVGTRVTLSDGAGGDRVLTLLGPWESRPEEGIISYESELGLELLGKAPGESVAVGGAALTIEAIEPYRE